MRFTFFSRSGAVFLGTIAIGSAVQANPFIHIDGRFVVSEGGTATAVGLLEIVKGQPVGRFYASFSRGALASVNVARVKFVQIPTVTAFFEGEGTAVIERFGILMPVRGVCFGYVDDLAGISPPQPDQIFMRFTTYDGRIFVRHGRATSGGITVNL